MGALRVTEQPVTRPSIPALTSGPAGSVEPTAAEVAEIVRGPELNANRFDPGSWGLLLVPVLTGIGLCVAMFFVG